MDFDISPLQQRLLDALRQVMGGHTRAPAAATLADVCDADVERSLCANDVVLDPALDLLDRVLLVEEAARLPIPVNAVATLLLRPMLSSELPPGPLAVRIGGADAPVRFGQHAVGVVDVTGASPTFSEADPSRFEPVASGTVAGYGIVAAGAAVTIPWNVSVAPSAIYRLGRAAEIAGAARSAVELTASFLNRRQQFGRRLSSFQALRHRLGELAVDVEATSTLVRMGAYDGTTVAMLRAALYAVEAASRIVPELHQLNGARGFTFESGLPVHTMRLVASRVELTTAGTSPDAYADAIWTA